MVLAITCSVSTMYHLFSKARTPPLGDFELPPCRDKYTWAEHPARREQSALGALAPAKTPAAYLGAPGAL